MGKRRDRPGNESTDDDAALFRAAVGPVRELPPAPLPPASPKPRPVPRMARRDEDDARSEFHRMLDAGGLGPVDTRRCARGDVPPRVRRRLGRGEYSAQEELDLPHAALAPAEALLRGSLKAARESGIGCARIAHGKGLHSDSRTPP